MSVIVRGVVSVEDGLKKPEEYSVPRKVRVELTFDVAEDDDAEQVLAHTAELADAQVKRLLGITTAKVARPTKPPATTVTEAATSTASETSAPASAPKQAGSRKPKPIEVKLADEPKADPAAVSAEVVEDDFSAPADASAAATTITDAELHSAAQKKNGEIKNPKAIRELVAKFRPAGTDGAFQLIEIPQPKRADFLKQLNGLTA